MASTSFNLRREIYRKLLAADETSARLATTLKFHMVEPHAAGLKPALGRKYPDPAS